MKPFLKTTLAATLGVLLASIITTTLFIIILSGIISSSETPGKLNANSILKIELNGQLNEYQPSLSSFSDDFFSSEEQMSIGLDEIRQALSIAKGNKNIIGVYLECGSFLSGTASLEEIRDALADFKESGKFVYAYADELFEQNTYYVCTMADSVFMNPYGMFGFYGMSSMPLFYTDILKKIGIKTEVFKVGSYKSAVEPFINTEMSEANRAQTTSLLNNVWENILSDISNERDITVEQLQQQADKYLLLQSNETILAKHFLDGLLYESDVMKLLSEKSGCTPQELQLVSVKKINKMASLEEEYTSDKIALLYAAGEINSKASYYQGSQEIVHQKLIEDIQTIQNDPHIKAVVFRVNSPGGSAFASEQICQAIRELKEDKPVVVSMGDYAASGGYYISCFANKIVAAPTTLTGSIGIFGMSFDAKELSEKIGLHYDLVKTNKYSDFGNLLRSMTPGERALMQRYVENGYDLFVDRCSKGRNIDNAQLRKIAEGRVWTGEQALEIGLVDQLGYLDDAIELAAELAGTEDYRLVSFPEKKDLFTQWMEFVNEDVSMKVAQKRYGENAYKWLAIKDFIDGKTVMARMPYTFQQQ